MPSIQDLPSLENLRQAFHDAVSGKEDPTEDGHAGSVYDHWAGIGAICWTWQAQRDKDQFQAIYFNTASGQELTDYVSTHDGIDRTLDTVGSGYIIVNRKTTTSGAGTFWKGSRILFFQNFGNNEYIVSSDISVGANAKSATIPISATFTGRNSLVNQNSVTPIASFEDPLWDNSWTINSIVCSAGTSYEKDADFKTRVNTIRKERRVGYSDIIRTVCASAGATNIFLFQSNFSGDNLDFGVNAVYVGDDGFNTSDTLREVIALQLESVRVLGADLFVLPMQSTLLNFNININLWTDPSKVNAFEVSRSARSAVIDYFNNSTSGFSYDLNAIAGSIRKLMPDVIQLVNFITPTSGAGILVSGALPTVLTKYLVNASNINITLSGPI